MWLLRRKRNVVKTFYWNHTYDGRVSVQHVPVLRLHSAHIQPVPLKKRMMFRVGQIPKHNRHKNCSAYSPLNFRREKYTNLQRAPEERMRVKHHTSMTALLNLTFSCCIFWKLSHGLWWRLTDIITSARTVLKRDLLSN
jgi:hypothetical protein